MLIKGEFDNMGAPRITAILISDLPLKSNVVCFIVDTGASRTTLTDVDAERLGIDCSKLRKFEEGMIGIGGVVDTYIIDNVELGFLGETGANLIKLKELFVLKHNVNNTEKERIKMIPSMLGRDIISRHTLIINDEKEAFLVNREAIIEEVK